MRILATVFLFCGGLAAQQFSCDLAAYKPQDGLKAELRNGAVELSWNGARGQQLRAALTLRDGRPSFPSSPRANPSGNWIVLGRNLTPEFEVTSGERRLSEQQMAPLRALGIAAHAGSDRAREVECVLGCAADGARRTGTISTCRASPKRSAAPGRTYHATGCKVKTDGARLEVDIPRPRAGHLLRAACATPCIAAPNLLRQEAIAKTDEPSVAYKYRRRA